MEQAIKPEVLVNRMDFEHFRIILAIVGGGGGMENQNKPLQCLERQGGSQSNCPSCKSEKKEPVKIKCLKFCGEGNREQWLGKEDKLAVLNSD